ncbi:MAG: hypothetical protein Q7R32_00435, partial [Dehalococcoidia bacterium]|nr:hypothetical protein [Dehalococcoidia bacterium]
IAVKDQAGTTRTIRATDNAAVHVYHSVPSSAGGVALYPAAAALSDTIANPTVPPQAALGLLWDPVGAVWVRERCNHEGTLLASAARTVDTDGANLTNHNFRGIMVILNITVASGTGGLVPKVRIVDVISGQTCQINPNITAIVATGRYGFEVYPGSSNTVGASGTGWVAQRTAACLAGLTIQVGVTVGDASSYTYSLSYCLLV